MEDSNRELSNVYEVEASKALKSSKSSGFTREVIRSACDQ